MLTLPSVLLEAVGLGSGSVGSLVCLQNCFILIKMWHLDRMCGVVSVAYCLCGQG